MCYSYYACENRAYGFQNCCENDFKKNGDKYALFHLFLGKEIFTNGNVIFSLPSISIFPFYASTK
jgi:hypothetical protein